MVKSFICVCHCKDDLLYPLITTFYHTRIVIGTISINIANATTRVTITHNNTTRVFFVSSSIG